MTNKQSRLSDPTCWVPHQSLNKAFMIHAVKESRSTDDRMFPHLPDRISTLVRSRSAQSGSMMLIVEQRTSAATGKIAPRGVFMAGMLNPSGPPNLPPPHDTLPPHPLMAPPPPPPTHPD